MGPGDGIQVQRLIDLPTTIETADAIPTRHVTGVHNKQTRQDFELSTSYLTQKQNADVPRSGQPTGG